MEKLTQEQRHLMEADRHIAAGERRVASQALLVGRLRAASRRTDVAEALLARLRDTLETWNFHRETILREIRRLQDAARTPPPPWASKGLPTTGTLSCAPRGAPVKRPAAFRVPTKRETL